jgi:TPR repeat protein
LTEQFVLRVRDRLVQQKLFGFAGLQMVDDSYDFEHASALVEMTDFARAWEYVLPFANSGDSNAQCMMGLLCQFGLSRDLKEAERWLRKAAEQDNAVAWNNLGTLLLQKGESESAKECYRKAVKLGFTMAANLAK